MHVQKLPELDIQEVVHNMFARTSVASGGQAEVSIGPWRTDTEYSTGQIAEGTLVAIKHLQRPTGHGKFKAITTRQEFEEARKRGGLGEGVTGRPPGSAPACPPACNACLPACLPQPSHDVPPPSLAADAYVVKALRTELHLLNILHEGGCGDRVIKPLAISRWDGEWWDDPEVRATCWFQVSPTAS